MDYRNQNIRPKLVTFPVKPKNANCYKGKRATFQAAMQVPVLMGQFFGLNPVLGVTSKDTSKVRFSYSSGRCIYTYITLFGQVFLLNGVFWFKYFTDTKASVYSTSTLIFFFTNTSTTIVFLRIATKWPALCQHISQTEAVDPLEDTTLVRKCVITSIVIMFLALAEHSMSCFTTFVYAIDCQPEKVYETFLLYSFHWIDQFPNHIHSFGALTQFLNLQCTFNWNFSNLFVICISFYLTARLQQINRKIEAVKGKYVPTSFWRTMREDYTRVTQLVRRVDDVIGSIIFISFANNLFFICVQLLHTLAEGIKPTIGCHDPDQRPFGGYEAPSYFTFSLVFLIARSLSVCLVACAVNTHSRQPLQALYLVPSPTFCIEITKQLNIVIACLIVIGVTNIDVRFSLKPKHTREFLTRQAIPVKFTDNISQSLRSGLFSVQRFIEQIHNDTVALTGLQFFNIKRGMVLTIASTIVTYELVLMQFNGVTPTMAPLHADDDVV